MKKFLYSAFIILFFLVVFSSQPVLAKNDCKRDECKITITINIAFVGATNQQMQSWENEIETVWNEPNFGKCECDVDFEVNTKSVPNCNHADAQGHHCIEVTVNQPTDNNGRKYVAFMWGVSQNANSINGKWWQNTSREIEGQFTAGGETYTPQAGEHFLDAAHEAGHMMGLDDDYDRNSDRYGNNLMGRTWGPNAKPTQSQIDKVIEKNCTGENAKCPVECCCGRNGKVDEDIDPKEECDPSAIPTGCEENEICTEKCKCEAKEQKPICGDGKITSPEQCDPNSSPSGCSADQECVNCVCRDKPTPLPPEETPIPSKQDEDMSDEDTKTSKKEADEDLPAEEPVCGDGEISGTEQCDPQASPIGCEPGYECIDCKCDYIEQPSAEPVCGDGEITPPEQCDPQASPVGCEPDYECIDCLCYFIEQGADNDSDGIEDPQDNCPDDYNPGQADSDADGLGNVCDPCTDVDEDGYATEGGNCGEVDCNDNNGSIYPGAEEICDGLDNNCDQIIDEGCEICTDNDGDGYAVEGEECGLIDCDDFSSDVYPGAEEICGDGADNDCDGLIDEDCEPCTDVDYDGYFSEGGICGPIDCNDFDPLVYPGAEEICGDGIDNNCNGSIDETCID